MHNVAFLRGPSLRVNTHMPYSIELKYDAIGLAIIHYQLLVQPNIYTGHQYTYIYSCLVQIDLLLSSGEQIEQTKWVCQ